MGDLMDPILGAICHRGGVHAEVLPLCLRCSSVYAGAALGVSFEVLLLLLRRGHAGRLAYGMQTVALAMMGVVGFGGMYGVLSASPWLKVFSAIVFGAALAFFAVGALVRLHGAERPLEKSLDAGRCAFIALMGAAAWSIARDWGWALHGLAVLASLGLPAIFLAANLALAEVILRGVRLSRRLSGATALSAGLIAAEWGLFFLWRYVLFMPSSRW